MNLSQCFAAIFHLLRQMIDIKSNNRNLFIPGDFNCHHPFWRSKGTSDSRVEEIFNLVISSELLPLTRFLPVLSYGNMLSIMCFFLKSLIFVALKSKNITREHFSLISNSFLCGFLHCLGNFKDEKCR